MVGPAVSLQLAPDPIESSFGVRIQGDGCCLRLLVPAGLMLQQLSRMASQAEVVREWTHLAVGDASNGSDSVR